MHQEHKDTITQNKLKQLKTRFGNLLRPPAWKQSRPILKEKDKQRTKEKQENEK